MEFNKIWTKEKNDQLRQMTKEHKSVDEIKKYFGKDLDHHPKKKYSYGLSVFKRIFETCAIENGLDIDGNKLYRFDNFVNEMYIRNPKKIKYKPDIKDSFLYKGEYNYNLYFTINNVEYVLMFIYYVSDVISYNIVFTTKEQYLEYEENLSNFIKTNTLNSINYKILINILEKETDSKKVNPNELMNALSYIVFDYYDSYLNKKYPNILFSIGETERKEKINFYRFVIKNSFTNITETESIEPDGSKMYYYKLKNKT